jgi:predicted NAD/FAD-binding protein
VNVAVVGAGISGLVAAHLLSREHAVTVFEAEGRIGGHTHTVDVESGGKRYAVDTGFIVFNEETYPNFLTLLGRLGVASQPSTMSFGVKCERTGVEYCPSSVDRLFAQRRNLLRPSFLRMVRDILRFRREAPGILRGRDEEIPLGAFLSRGGYSREFTERFLVPMGASIWSAEPERFLEFPVRAFVRFFENHRFLSLQGQPLWRVIRGGSRSYLDPLTRPFRDRVRLNAPVECVRRFGDRVEVTPRGGAEERFDQVVIAAHSDQALRMLADPSDAERKILSAIPYLGNRTVLHTDASLLPSRRKAWAAWNYLVPRERKGLPAVSYNMNILQGISAPVEFLVTLNCEERIFPGKVLREMTYHHPVYTPAGFAAQARNGEISGVRRTWYCGAYWGWGFHEDGVNSALAVCRRLGVPFP